MIGEGDFEDWHERIFIERRLRALTPVATRAREDVAAEAWKSIDELLDWHNELTARLGIAAVGEANDARG